MDEGDIDMPAPPERFRQGQLLTLPIDSGVPHCRWHRVRIDADVPAGCSVQVAVSASEEENPVPQGSANADPNWSAFEAGVPHPNDWQTEAGTLLDYLVQQPAGRYLFVRIRLTGDGTATPRVRRVRLDFERNTSLQHLPALYRENPDAEDFTERFLSIFDAQLENLDEAIQGAPALLHAASLPDELLPWLASFLDAGFDAEWTARQRRRILLALPALYRRRGTVVGMRQVLELVVGAEPALTEYAYQRAWGAIGATTLVGQTRLFGRGRARFRLGDSALCRSPLNNFGDPRQDPFAAQAFRFRVAMPAAGAYRDIDVVKLTRLVEAQKPAHTVAVVSRSERHGFLVGREIALGVDTLLTTLPPSVLGRNGNVRLGRHSVLYGRRPGAGLHTRLGAETALDCGLRLN
jgi:phage tail-like protein